MSTWEFELTLRGVGDTEGEAWTDAVDAFCQDPGDPHQTTQVSDDEDEVENDPGDTQTWVAVNNGGSETKNLRQIPAIDVDKLVWPVWAVALTVDDDRQMVWHEGTPTHYEGVWDSKGEMCRAEIGGSELLIFKRIDAQPPSSLVWTEENEHPDHPFSDWMYEVSCKYTESGYDTWVNHQIEMGK